MDFSVRITAAITINNSSQTQTAMLWRHLSYSQDIFHIDGSMYHDPKVILWAPICVCVFHGIGCKDHLWGNSISLLYLLFIETIENSSGVYSIDLYCVLEFTSADYHERAMLCKHLTKNTVHSFRRYNFKNLFLSFKWNIMHVLNVLNRNSIYLGR